MNTDKAKGGLVLKIVLVVAGILLVLAGYFGITMYQEYQSTGAGTEETVTIDVEQGESTWDIAAKLKDKKLVLMHQLMLVKLIAKM